MAEGVWVRPFGDVVYLMPPLVIDDSDLGQLIEAVNGFHLWSEAFEAPDRDVFHVQQRIADSIARPIAVSIADGPPDKTMSRPSCSAA